MTFPPLEPSSRDKEFNSYSVELRALSVQAWLFNGKTHREIDREVLGLDSSVTKGYQSMGILHYIGLKANTRNIFSGIDFADAINIINSNSNNSSALIPYINFKSQSTGISLSQLIEKEQKEIQKSRFDKPENRKARLKTANTKPKRIRVYTYIYERNPDVVAEALERANGKCEQCGQKAPFTRKSSDTPYLEVHHMTPLSENGKDTIDNVKALCPNCHRQFHHG
jgi:5-methylcytosine-specific restriction enzyme A